uniref:TIGR02186 family protein n=1 Tax=Yoonia sp. TaxID=2212373 RepID=UPI0040478BE1
LSIFLTRDRTVVETYTATIPVQKVGLERWLYTLAQEQALLYGLLSLLIAISAGWGASAVFGLLRR